MVHFECPLTDSECKVFIKKKKGKGFFHPKLYLFFNETHFGAIIGSSNFTLGGVFNNIECNILISGPRDDIFIKLNEYFESIWDLESSINILNNNKLLEQYTDLFNKISNSYIQTQNRFLKVQEKIYEETDVIINSSKNVLNEDFAYLLGLISGNGILNLTNNEVIIDFYRQKVNIHNQYSGYYFYPEISDYMISQEEAHKKDIERIKERLSKLVKLMQTSDKLKIEHVRGFHFRLHILFSKESRLFSEIIKNNIPTLNNKALPFIPEKIYNSDDRKIIISFLSGYCDLKSRIAASDGIYHYVDGKRVFSSLRMGISFPHGQAVVLDKFCNLFKKIEIKKISKTNPQKRTRENLIRIDVRNVPYELLGTHWRRIFLKDFQYFIEQKNKKYDLKLLEQ